MYIPEEIIQYIIDFMMGTCNRCSALFHFSEIHYNLTEIEYRTIFDDDFHNPPQKTYPYICTTCMVYIQNDPQVETTLAKN